MVAVKIEQPVAATEGVYWVCRQITLQGKREERFEKSY